MGIKEKVKSLLGSAPDGQGVSIANLNCQRSLFDPRL